MKRPDDVHMKRLKQFLEVFGFLSPILFSLLVAIIAAILIDYHPFNTLLSRQVLSWEVKNVSNKHLDVALVALQHAVELNPNNCEVYPILSNIYENLAFG